LLVPATPDTTPPTAPTSLVAQPISQKQINLGWIASTDPGTPSTGVKEYRIYRDNSQVGTLLATSCNTDLCTWGQGGLRSATTYTFTVGSVDYAGNVSLKSNPASATTFKTKRGDINGDNTVNSADLSILAANWGKTGATAADGDLNGDGTVNSADLAILAAGWGG
jgi:hypothetical protein